MYADTRRSQIAAQRTLIARIWLTTVTITGVTIQLTNAIMNHCHLPYAVIRTVNVTLRQTIVRSRSVSRSTTTGTTKVLGVYSRAYPDAATMTASATMTMNAQQMYALVIITHAPTRLFRRAAISITSAATEISALLTPATGTTLATTHGQPTAA
jgi:hypothetical protein